MPNAKPDLTDATDEYLVQVAAAAFQLGLHDGRALKKQRTCDVVISAIVPRGVGRLPLHALYLHQVYSAGFDIAKKTHGIKKEAV